jgi:hypothetical protein
LETSESACRDDAAGKPDRLSRMPLRHANAESKTAQHMACRAVES